MTHPGAPLAVPAFKTPELAKQWDLTDPELRGVLRHIDDWLFDSGMERMTVTDIGRTAVDQERIYAPDFIARGYSPEEAKKLARKKPSWHLVNTPEGWRAADWRHSVKPYSSEEIGRITKRIEELCPRGKWETLHHSVGLGLHFHIALRTKRQGAV